MIKLIKTVDNELVYWEVWEDNKTLQVHYGVVGDIGETVKVKLKLFEKAEKVMEKLTNEKINEGYEHLVEEELIELIVQHSYTSYQMEEALEKRHMVEELMNECLGWTGNGSCDGGDIGSGNTNVFNYVIDLDKALKTIIEELSNNNLLENVKIAYLNKDEEYVSLYPEGTDFDII
ncbi:hypothetical protein [Paenibacillus sedimenti]|uniref:WGR domain-containing protein n=1 Tax=Paenibacillus sedimenti TaxID=2770274 RepID=A0A926KYY3_9BACL|nr:hypothetical protein [Paenibacillus sedimenti]MBD0384803.1 hypothetical protein [Paenibacillus sedimenti]